MGPRLYRVARLRFKFRWRRVTSCRLLIARRSSRPRSVGTQSIGAVQGGQAKDISHLQGIIFKHEKPGYHGEQSKSEMSELSPSSR